MSDTNSYTSEMETHYSQLLQLREAALYLSDMLHFAEEKGFLIPKDVDEAWLKLSLCIEESRSPATGERGA